MRFGLSGEFIEFARSDDDRRPKKPVVIPRNHAIGVAFSEYSDTGVACAAEGSIENGRPRIHRVLLTADVGHAVHPLDVESQMQGGVIFGLSQWSRALRVASRRQDVSKSTVRYVAAVAR